MGGWIGHGWICILGHPDFQRKSLETLSLGYGKSWDLSRLHSLLSFHGRMLHLQKVFFSTTRRFLFPFFAQAAQMHCFKPGQPTPAKGGSTPLFCTA